MCDGGLPSLNLLNDHPQPQGELKSTTLARIRDMTPLQCNWHPLWRNWHIQGANTSKPTQHLGLYWHKNCTSLPSRVLHLALKIEHLGRVGKWEPHFVRSSAAIIPNKHYSRVITSPLIMTHCVCLCVLCTSRNGSNAMMYERWLYWS